ncbi:ATP-binding cassette domain-containing protein [Neoehrlichia mikurensis]|uniref:ATP-binding cassette domain-containing protein n=1 Tax=Neoehrlichia mikurensis TaxID=89586 RepID=A0A9Q9BY07_9RICK|nr:ABC transporter transmembrane domain-containing protein [Neoehrlichia mikurensis]QXK91723.1 ATP-binding cassette domain-containing protein [Neoehrlichia mikurensis]QXK92935.1 ATP-binding cassette domain-containing protein [Neoehrlichia mikurensis]QXK93413.1 ATP-binding cassette domain-containing protein [Neoehrlichia mikurensis]UTO55636.1 ATP-binding cassette domain-containing protein [Neoehrlichia mikurensis]UTO56557.1 ATP-binding cassette domain-containing protein [Neoehrlichia mikurensis
MKILFSYIKPHILYFVFAYAAVIISSVTILTFGRGLHTLIDVGFFTNTTSIKGPFFMMLAIIAVMALTSFFRMWLTGYGSEKVIRDIRIGLYNKIIYLPPSFFEKVSTSSLMTKLITDTSILQSILSSSMSVILRNATTFLGSVAMLIHTNLKLTIYTIIIIPIILTVLAFFGKKVRLLSKCVNNKTDEIADFSDETCRGINVIQSFVREAIVSQQFTLLLDQALSITKKYICFRALLVTLIITSVMGSIGLVLWVGIQEVVAHNITSGALFAFLFYSTLAAGSINSIGDNIQDLQRATRISEGISQLLNVKSDIIEIHNPKVINSIKKLISINNVTFYYPTKLSVPALRNVNLSINVGEKVALVGPSGSGKSTLINALLRFYDVNDGNISIDGVDIKQLSLHSLRSLFSIIPQNPVIFSGTILDNITYGVSNYTYEELINAAENAYIMDFINGLPDKFSTFVGEKGLCLSEGQRQRIIIARAVLKKSEVLILDEATSSLDSRNEKAIQNALDKIMHGKTMIMIAHRLSTVMKADKIVIFNNGVIEEIGTHESLMKNPDGLYMKLVKLQLLTNNDSTE